MCRYTDSELRNLDRKLADAVRRADERLEFMTKEAERIVNERIVAELTVTGADSPDRNVSPEST